ncbi:MAG: 3-phosphoserine/phosphohydroxythreonine transaminase [Magnetococcales bacterium]|nr:3-phosphoserine/phosphohydroxythreonine transaminase [Magnetococcales bacterium]
MGRVYNFSAGPAALPVPVLERARDEMLDYQGSGMSVMEMSHRSKKYLAIIEHAEQMLRSLMGISADYEVLFQQGGATLQFAMLPMNLITDPKEQTADYILTGSWSKKAMKEAKKIFSKIRVAASSEEVAFTRIPTQTELNLNPEAVYCHITTNNTIYGTEYHYTPDTGKVPLVADMSSNILSRTLDVNRFGCIYAGAQKNLGPSGVTVVVIRKDLLGRQANLPVMLDYKAQAAEQSMLNTPPTYAIYILGLVLDWIKEQGGVAGIEQRNIRQAQRLYQVIDASGFYQCPNQVDSRSRMNIPFTLSKPELTETFLSESNKAGLVTLKGHRSVGGMRASIYNAMPDEGVEALAQFMTEFERRHG